MHKPELKPDLKKLVEETVPPIKPSSNDQLEALGLTDNVLIQANKIIHGRAQDDYGKPERCHANIAKQWNSYLYMKYGRSSMGVGGAITAEDVCYMMMLLKMVRDIHRPKQDNLVDACGYIALVDEIRKEKNVL